MAVYGQYETVAELGRTGATTVSRARPADGGWDLGFDALGTDANFALKAFHVRRADDVGGEEIERFLGRVRAQQRAVELGARHWAPILQSGTAGDDAYYVTHYYPRSAEKIAHAAAGVDAHTLYAVVAGALEGLLELRRIQDRPHGNLKVTNVLIAGKGRITPGDIVLTDLAVEEDATIGGEVEDLFNLGEIIHHVVLGTRFAGQHTWPVPLSPEWTRFGKRGDRWLALCNYLLSPRAAENWLRVDDIFDEVAALRPRKKRLRSRKLWLTLAVLAVVGGVGAGGYVRYTNQWRELCAAYGDWVGPVSSRLAQDPPREITQDAYLQDRLVRAFDDARRQNLELDPRVIAGSDRPLPALAEHPPLSFSAAWKTEKAARLIHGIDDSLAPQHWTAMADVGRRRADYDKCNWPRLAEYATSISQAAAAQKGADRLAAIGAIADGNARLTRLDTARDVARARLDRLVARADGASVIRDRIAQYEAILRGSADSDIPSPSAPAVDTLTRQLQHAEQIVGKFDDAVPLLAEAAKRQRAYEVRGWSGAARAIGALLDRARPEGQLAGLNDDLTAAKRGWDTAEAEWAQIETRRRLFETSGDRILATYRNYVAQSGLGDAPDLAALARKLEAINDNPSWIAAAKKVAAPEWATFDVVDFAQKSEAHRGFAGKTVATTTDLHKWLSEVEGYGSQLASATMKPDAGTAKPGKVDDGPPQIITVPRPPTTFAAATSQPTPPPTTMAAAVAKPAPTTVASATSRPSPTTREMIHPSPTTLALQKPAPTRIEATQPSPTTVAVVTPKPAPPPPPPDPEKLRLQRERELREKEIASFIAESREVAIKAVNRDIKDAWQAKNAEVADRVQSDHALYVPALKVQRDTFRRRLLQLDNAYQSTAAPLAIKPPPAVWGAPLVAALKAAAPRRADELKALITLATANDPKFESALGELDDLDTQWRGAAAHLVADAARVEALLEQGHLPGVKSADGAVLASALSAVRTSDLYKNTDTVQQSLEPLLRPVSIVESEGNAPGTMRMLAESGDQPLGVRLAAWAKAGKEISKDTLEADLKLGQSLLATAQVKVPDKSRIDSIKTRLEGDLRARWTALLQNAKSDQDVEAVIAMRDKISGIDLAQLTPRARFNFALRDLRSVVAAAKGNANAKDLAAAAQKLKQAVASLDPPEAARPTVTALVAEIDRLGQNPQVDFAKLGPASEAARLTTGGKVNWNAAIDPAGDKVTYRALLATDAGNEEVALVFRRVRPGGADGGSASWLCTTETSMGLFSDLISVAGKWTDVRAAKLLPDYDPRRDPRQGPRVWEWPLYARAPEITKTKNWLSDSFVPYGVDHYPRAIAGELNENYTQIGSPITRDRAPELNPSRRQPMQYVSAKAAMLAAAVAGCRLPTAAEWQAANAGIEKPVSINLRDQTWRLELDHMSKRPFAGRCRPDAGMFVPAGEKPSDEIVPRGDGRELNDGVLWFHEVPATPAPVFVDLIGNVAEFVTGDGGKVHVIGGSALSPPARKLDQPFPLAADQQTAAFSDVGFRLAFSEPAASMEKLATAVTGNWYLTAR